MTNDLERRHQAKIATHMRLHAWTSGLIKNFIKVRTVSGEINNKYH